VTGLTKQSAPRAASITANISGSLDIPKLSESLTQSESKDIGTTWKRMRLQHPKDAPKVGRAAAISSNIIRLTEGHSSMKRKISARFFDWLTYIGVTLASLFGLA
jgi:hypothetical protein